MLAETGCMICIRATGITPTTALLNKTFVMVWCVWLFPLFVCFSCFLSVHTCVSLFNHSLCICVLLTLCCHPAFILRLLSGPRKIPTFLICSMWLSGLSSVFILVFSFLDCFVVWILDDGYHLMIKVRLLFFHLLVFVCVFSLGPVFVKIWQLWVSVMLWCTEFDADISPPTCSQ